MIFLEIFALEVMRKQKKKQKQKINIILFSFWKIFSVISPPTPSLPPCAKHILGQEETENKILHPSTSGKVTEPNLYKSGNGNEFVIPLNH